MYTVPPVGVATAVLPSLRKYGHSQTYPVLHLVPLKLRKDCIGTKLMT